jgi:nickel-dependent lactate racemase
LSFIIIRLTGLGIHRYHTKDEKKKLVGDSVYNNIATTDSDFNYVKLIGLSFIFNVIVDDSKNIMAAVAGANNEAY